MIKKLSQIQAELKAPKNQRNTFGNYNYRNCEDILEAVKPLLKEFDISLTITDEIVLVGDRFYVKATAKISDGTNEISTTAFAREAETKKGMDEAQITGSASSYARKYALNGLFCIDDTKDADSTNKHGKDEIKQDIPKETKANEEFANVEQKNELKAKIGAKDFSTLMNAHSGKLPVREYNKLMEVTC
jgi:hypothetical protein